MFEKEVYLKVDLTICLKENRVISFLIKKNIKSVQRSATSDSIRERCVIKIDIAPNEHNCDDTITLIIIGYACASRYTRGTIIKI